MAQIILKKIHIQIVFQLSSKKNDSLSIFQFSNTFFFLVGSQIFNFLAYMEPSRLLQRPESSVALLGSAVSSCPISRDLISFSTP